MTEHYNQSLINFSSSDVSYYTKNSLGFTYFIIRVDDDTMIFFKFFEENEKDIFKYLGKYSINLKSETTGKEKSFLLNKITPKYIEFVNFWDDQYLYIAKDMVCYDLIRKLIEIND